MSIINTPDVKKHIKDRLMDFLGYNSHHLPMYARPQAVDDTAVQA